MDSEARIVSSLQAASADVELPPLPPSRLRNVIGLGLQEALQQLYPEATTIQAERLVARYRHHFLTASQIVTPLFPGAKATLAQLQQQGYLLAVATGKGRQGLQRAFAESETGDYFVASRCADECHSKPHPQMLLELLALFDVAPTRALMVGDTEYDLQMASSAGVAAVAVCYGVHEPQRLQALQPLACLEAISELPAWLAACS